MHKDISGVLTVSTCLLNRDRNSVSDFTQTSPPHRPTCVLYLASSPRACDSTTDTTHEKTKKSCAFSEMSASSRLELLFAWHIRLPVFPLHSEYWLSTFEINNTYFTFLFSSSPRNVGNANGASVKLLPNC